MNLRTKLRTICHTPLVCRNKINSEDAVLFQLVGVEVAMVNVLVSELRSLGLGPVTRDITLYVLGQDTLFSQCLSAPWWLNGYWQIQSWG